MWEEAYQEYEKNRKYIRQIEENGKPKFVLMTDDEHTTMGSTKWKGCK